MRKHTLIAFEGPDKTGKTTLAKELSSALDFEYLYGVPKEFFHLRQIIGQVDSNLCRLLFYLLSNCYNMKRILERTNHKGVVLDRFLFSSLAYHSLISDIDLSYFIDLFKSSPDFQWPDLVVHVSADFDTRIERLSQSGEKTMKENRSIQKQLNTFYHKFFNQVNCRIFYIDTTNCSPKQSLSKIIQFVKSEEVF